MSFINKHKQRVKELVLNSKLLTKLYRLYQFNGFFKRKLSTRIKGSGNTINKNSSVVFINTSIIIEGNNNSIIIEDSCILNNVRFYIRGNGHQIILGKSVKFYRHGEFWVEDNNCKIVIGEESTFEDVHFGLTENNSKVEVGSGCMFSTDIDIRTGDSHSILDAKTNVRINYAEDVKIGDRVWVGAHCSILKGSEILNDCIVGTRSVVTQQIKENNIILAGIPAIKVKEGIKWDIRRL